MWKTFTEMIEDALTNHQKVYDENATKNIQTSVKVSIRI